ncbi:hypothetical protein PV327_008150 [Microctonus hyperodae]|uniref:Uncharacterized protein n=1 Tax=Microctonus hyperodae TaxID=165561 RepID=A0AA39F2I1_MICHY|nr:hypothetical protein PV327_008150 [Microctonus hyperodae]
MDDKFQVECSKSFESSSIPGIKVEIHCIIFKNTFCHLFLTKIPRTPIKATITINSGCGVPQLIETVISFMVEHKSEIIKLEDFEDFYCRKPEILLEFAVRSVAADD